MRAEEIARHAANGKAVIWIDDKQDRIATKNYLQTHTVAIIITSSDGHRYFIEDGQLDPDKGFATRYADRIFFR